MSRFFNTTGPCNPAEHYMLDPAERLINANLSLYVEKKLYWVLHAPRQTGKTTFLQSWASEINNKGKAVACYVSVERCQGMSDIRQSMPDLCSAIRESANSSLEKAFIPSEVSGSPGSLLSLTLIDWASKVAPKPLVVLFDEVDILKDDTMISFLRQLRSGFATRGIGKFPVSTALVGMRDLRDYLVQSKDGVPLNPGSPFNIKQDSVTLGNFSLPDIQKLIAQHEEEKGQNFEPDAVEMIYDFTRGQPWLVNAIAQKCVWKIVPEEEKKPVKAEHILQAKEMLIQERAVHLDSLAERLKEPRVKRVIQAIITGDIDPSLAEGDDFRLCIDLGIVSVEDGTPQISNPIYREVIPRVLNQGMQYAVPKPHFKWLRDDGTLNMPEMLKNFQAFWRRHADTWEQKSDYTEAFPHLLVLAFMQRIINGGGRVEREYAAGRGRMDIAIEYGGKWSIIEVKLVHPADGLETTISEGLEQISSYRDTIDENAEAFLLVFDRRRETVASPWEERLKWETRTFENKSVTVLCQ
ncbi:MAG: AAA-like domain-containing protein [Candidatus Riflebacteria bacterium]|nr:AAA-like domain-containing protein [Candidatus Riflebacteria bacterium]